MRPRCTSSRWIRDDPSNARADPTGSRTRGTRTTSLRQPRRRVTPCRAFDKLDSKERHRVDRPAGRWLAGHHHVKYGACPSDGLLRSEAWGTSREDVHLRIGDWSRALQRYGVATAQRFDVRRRLCLLSKERTTLLVRSPMRHMIQQQLRDGAREVLKELGADAAARRRITPTLPTAKSIAGCGCRVPPGRSHPGNREDSRCHRILAPDHRGAC